MPPVVSVLQKTIDSMLEAAIQVAIIQTAVLNETNGGLVKTPDTRSAEIKEFERVCLGQGVTTPAFRMLAEKVFGEKLNPSLPTGKIIKPVWRGVLKLTRPEGNTTEEHIPGLAWGTSLMFVNSKGETRSADGKKFTTSFNSLHVEPATEDEVRALVTGLFTVRPAATVKLFRVPDKDGVAGLVAEEEE